MEEPPESKRAIWQFHLSTAIVTMIVAGLSLPFLIRAYQHARDYSTYNNGNGNVGINFFAGIFLLYAGFLFTFAVLLEWYVRYREAMEKK